MSLHERFEALLEDTDEGHKFARIPEAERLHPSRRLCALLKVASLMIDPGSFDIDADRDSEILLPSDDEMRPISDEDLLYLVRCGVCHDKGNECMYMFC